MSDGDIDMVNRDPNGINAHLGVRSFDTYYLFIIIIIVIIIVIVNFDDVTLKILKRALIKYTKFYFFLIWKCNSNSYIFAEFTLHSLKQRTK